MYTIYLFAHPQYDQKGFARDQSGRDVEVPLRRKIFVFLMLLCFAIVAIAGGWYLLQPKSQENGRKLASDFSLTDLDGNTFRLSDFRGKVVVIDFMSTRCGSCREQIPYLKVVWEKEDYGGKIVLMSIDIDPTESAQTLGAFAQEFPYATWIWARDTANLGQIYEVTSIPKTVIIDEDGYIGFTHTDVTTASILIQEIDQLMR